MTNVEDEVTKLFPSATAYSAVAPVDRYVRGVVEGRDVKALVDTGADACVISETLAQTFGYAPTADAINKIDLPNGKHLYSIGTNAIPFKFRGEPLPHSLHCCVIRNCRDDFFALGKRFLQATGTLTKYASRVQKTIRALPKVLRMRLIGHDSERFLGTLDGQRAAAVPDSGSDVNLISSWYARDRGFRINTDPAHQLLLEFADGTTAWTNGVVQSARWEFGGDGEAIQTDFYVLDTLPSNVEMVLNADFVFDFDISSQYAHCFVDVDADADYRKLYNIRLIGEFSQELAELEDTYSGDVTLLRQLHPSEAFSPKMQQRELVFRGDVRALIEQLDPGQKDEAKRAELDRQKRWQLAWEDHLANTNTPAVSSSPDNGSTDPGPEGSSRPNVTRRRSVRIPLFFKGKLWLSRRT